MEPESCSVSILSRGLSVKASLLAGFEEGAGAVPATVGAPDISGARSSLSSDAPVPWFSAKAAISSAAASWRARSSARRGSTTKNCQPSRTPRLKKRPSENYCYCPAQLTPLCFRPFRPRPFASRLFWAWPCEPFSAQSTYRFASPPMSGALWRHVRSVHNHNQAAHGQIKFHVPTPAGDGGCGCVSRHCQFFWLLSGQILWRWH